LKLYPSKKSALLAALIWMLPGLAGCGSETGTRPASGAPLDRVAWLGSAEGWGLLGLPLEGGPLVYLRAENLESPTWAPPELGAIAAAWPGRGAVWVQFADSRIALYDYRTGHLLNFDSLKASTETAVALEDGSGLVVGLDESRLAIVSESESWHVRLDAPLERLVGGGDGRVVVVVQSEPLSEVLVLEPPETEPLARRQVGGVKDLFVTSWGDRLYYLSEDDSDLTVHGLSLPELGDAEEFPLPEAGRAVAVTPSGHRVYVAAGRDLYVFDRLRRELIRKVALPGAASALRFGANGVNLMARLDGEEVAVFQVGVDSLLGVIAAEWDDHLPVGLPGGRLVVRLGGELILYDTPRWVEVARAQIGEGQVWLPVKWQPPRPRIELASRSARRPASRVARSSPASADTSGAADLAEVEGARPGYYAVVAAARQRGRVADLVAWLRGVGYPSVVDRHTDVMGVTWFRAMVGPYSGRERAEGTARSLSARYGYKPWILRVEERADSLPMPEGEGVDRDDRSGEADAPGAVMDRGGRR
jgi:hypothetical protein